MAQIMYTYVLNEKIICVETVSGIGGREWKRTEEEVNSSMIYLIHYKNLCKTPMYPTQHTNNKK
jgi:hypothetical protein